MKRLLYTLLFFLGCNFTFTKIHDYKRLHSTNSGDTGRALFSCLLDRINIFLVVSIIVVFVLYMLKRNKAGKAKGHTRKVKSKEKNKETDRK